MFFDPRSKVCNGINICCGKFSGLDLGDKKCIDIAKKSIDELNCPTTCPNGEILVYLNHAINSYDYTAKNVF